MVLESRINLQAPVCPTVAIGVANGNSVHKEGVGGALSRDGKGSCVRPALSLPWVCAEVRTCVDG